MRRRVPRLTTDEEAEAYMAQDLSDLDFSQLEPARFEFEKKSERINMRVPKPLLDARGAGQPSRHTLHPLHPRTHGARNLPARAITRGHWRSRVVAGYCEGTPNR